MTDKIKVTIWDEDLHSNDEAMKAVYPQGIRGVVAAALEADDRYELTMVHAQMAEYGLTEELLKDTDVLIFWAHRTHDMLPDSLAQSIQQQVLEGMGFIVLHSAHLSKPFKALMGTSCTLRYKYPDKGRVFVTCPSHPIAEGLPDFFELDPEELYGEFFDIPKPDDVVFTSWFEGGHVFRGGCTWTRGYGKIFYFHAGHDVYPSLHHPCVQKILKNAVDWAKPSSARRQLVCTVAE